MVEHIGTDVRAIIHYALVTRHRPNEGVMMLFEKIIRRGRRDQCVQQHNYGPYLHTSALSAMLYKNILEYVVWTFIVFFTSFTIEHNRLWTLCFHHSARVVNGLALFFVRLVLHSCNLQSLYHIDRVGRLYRGWWRSIAIRGRSEFAFMH